MAEAGRLGGYLHHEILVLRLHARDAGAGEHEHRHQKSQEAPHRHTFFPVKNATVRRSPSSNSTTGS